MSKKFNFTKKNERSGRIENVGYIDLSANEEKTRASLYFYGDIVSSTWESWWDEESKCPQDIADFLKELEDYDDIDIYFNSGGGEAYAGLAIYNQLQRFKGHKVGYVDGISASISSVIMFACDELHFSTGALAMIHKPLTYAGYGNAIDLQKAIDRLDAVEESILDVYMQHAKEGVTREELKNLMAEETWFDSDSIEEIFNLEVEEKAAVAASMSDFYDRYKKCPVKEKSQGVNMSIDKKDISDAVNEAINKCFAEREKAQKEKNEILNDLYKFGV